MTSSGPNTTSTPHLAQQARHSARAVAGVVMLWLLLVACGTTADQQESERTEPEATTIDIGNTAADDNQADTGIEDLGDNLIYTPQVDDVICNGDRKVIGVIGNAKPNEALDFHAPDSPFVLVGEAKGDGTMPLYWRCLPSEGNREWSIVATGLESGRDVTFVIVGRLPPPAKPGGIVANVVDRQFSCDDEERELATFENLTPNVEVDIDVQPEGFTIIDDRADENGVLTVRWRCTTADVPTSWLLVLHESTPEPRRRTSFRFNATDEPYQPPADIRIFEDPFVCDGEVREFAVISKFIPGEFVRFTSPQTKNLRGGNADANGKLRIRWQCDLEQANFRWKVTATGGSSLATVTFDIIGAAPE